MTAPIEVSGTAGTTDLLSASSISDFRAVVGSVYRITLHYLIKFKDVKINIMNEKFFIVVNSRRQKYMRCPSFKSSLYVLGEKDWWVNFEIRLPRRFRIKGAMKWIIVPVIMRNVYVKINKMESSGISIRITHSQQPAKRHKRIRILYPYFIFIFKVKYAKIPEKRKIDRIIQVICFSFYAFKLLTAYFNHTR